MKRLLTALFYIFIFIIWLCVASVAKTSAEPPKKKDVKIELTDEERNFLAGKQFRLGIDSNRLPFEYIDSQGRYVGMSAEFIIELAKRLNITIDPQKDVKWKEALEKTKTGEIDIIPKITPSEERRKFLLFTEPYTTNPSVIVTRKNQTIKGFDDLYKIKTGIVKGLIIEARLKVEHPKLSLVQMPDIETALKELSNGTIDALVDNLGTVSFNIDKIGLSNLKVAASTPYMHDLAIGVRKDWPLLASALSKALRSMDEQEIRQIKYRWVAIKYDPGIDWKTIGPIIGALSIIVIFVFLWNRRLVRVMRKHKKVQEELKEYTGNLELISAIKSQIAEIAAKLHTAATFEELAQTFMANIAPVLNADYGVFYVFDKREDHFRPAGGYGAVPDDMSRTFALGQGLIGQCAREMEPIMIDAGPECHVSISCGFAEIRPKYVALYPVKYLDSVLGVVELAALSHFDKRHQPILDELIPVVAMNLIIIERNLNTQFLMEAANKQKDQYRALFEYSQDAIMTLAPPDWRFKSANPATLSLFNVSTEEEFVKLGPWDLSPEYQPDGAPSAVMAQQAIGKAMEQGYNHFEWTHKTIDGRDFPTTVTLTKMTSCETQYLQANVRNIAQQKRAEETVLRSKQELEEKNRAVEEILQSSPIGIGISTGGVLRFCNPIFTQWTNLVPGDKTVQAYVNPDDRARLIQIMERDGIARDYELQMRCPDGSVIDLLATYMKIPYEGEDAILGWLVNVSSIKKLNVEEP
ncbi:MAG: transporter substrate-binding domain-containing protein [Nitrospirae bacterium]|nr:transporter substrate-binding domain-containing protein [Nitrospirota bacterium]